MWDDSGNTLVHGTGPIAQVLDPDGTPNNIIDVVDGGSLQVDWSFSGTWIGLLNFVQFTVQLFADPVGPGANTLVGSKAVAGAPVTPPGPKNYTTTITIAPNSLAVGAYRLTTLITCTLGTSSFPIAGFVDGPILQVRPGP